MQTRDEHINSTDNDKERPLILINDGTERVYREFNGVEEQMDFSNRNKPSVRIHSAAKDLDNPIASKIAYSNFTIGEKDMVLSSLWRQRDESTIKNGASKHI